MSEFANLQIFHPRLNPKERGPCGRDPGLGPSQVRKWTKDRGKEIMREKADFPWFWGWDENTQDFAGGKDFDGNRWNDLHYTRAAKLAARERKEGR